MSSFSLEKAVLLPFFYYADVFAHSNSDDGLFTHTKAVIWNHVLSLTLHHTAPYSMTSSHSKVLVTVARDEDAELYDHCYLQKDLGNLSAIA